MAVAGGRAAAQFQRYVSISIESYEDNNCCHGVYVMFFPTELIASSPFFLGSPKQKKGAALTAAPQCLRFLDAQALFLLTSREA
jgi:hypothetical protein